MRRSNGLLLLLCLLFGSGGCGESGDLSEAGAATSGQASASEADGRAPGRPFDAANLATGEGTLAGRPDREFVIERDRFPSADMPRTVSAAEATWIDDASDVFGVLVEGEARAYPIRFLALHHVVNDRVAGKDIAVTYCILCSSGVAYEAELDGTVLRLGVAGAWRGVALLFDRQSDSLWLHLTGECIEGRWKGRSLRRLDSGRHTTWRDWRTLHPETTVMAPLPQGPGGIGRLRYHSDDEVRRGQAFMPPALRPTLAPVDERMFSSALLYGVRVGRAARAYPFARLRREGIVEESIEGRRITIWFDPASSSAAAFDPEVDGRLLDFRRAADGVVRDQQTGSTWTLEGVCVRGVLRGKRLAPLDGRVSEWYGWVAHFPETSVY